MCEELNHVHLPSCQLVADGGTGGVAVGPGTAVDQVQRAATGRRAGAAAAAAVAMVTEAVMKAAVPALEGTRQRRALHLYVHPVTEEGRGENERSVRQRSGE